MASRLKEDEKNERIIRGLLKQPENKRCINCNSLGPQYVCTTFWTFVCTNCSGIHREFTHRVKSISMAKFTSQEVSALQEGGNQRAKDIYFKGLDPHRQSLPDGSNVERLREFIRHVYVDKRYTVDLNSDKAPRGKMGDREELHGSRSPDGPRSPQYEDANERRYGDRSSSGGRSPGFEPGSRQYGDYNRSPSRPEVVNDWSKDGRFGSRKKFGDYRDEESKLEGRSPERVKEPGSSSPLVVRPVREILGDSVMPLRVGEPPKADGVRSADGAGHTRRTASLGSLGSINDNPQETKLVASVSSVSLIDFDADPVPTTAKAAATLAQQMTVTQPVVQKGSSNENWASFDVVPGVQASQPPSIANTLDSLLSELSVPSSIPAHMSGIPSGSGLPVGINPPAEFTGDNSVSPFSDGASVAPAVSSFSTVPTGPALPPATGQWPSVQQQQQQPSLFPAHVGHSTTQNFALPPNGSSSNQPWNPSLASNVQTPLSTSGAQLLQGVSRAVQEITPGGSQPSPVDVKSTGRKELPADLFTATYPSYPAVPGWQAGPSRGMGFHMQYNNTAMHFPTFPQPAKSSNPFDFSNEPPARTQTFPSMASLQGALPNTIPPSGLMRTPSLGSVPPSWMPSQMLPHPSGMPSQTLPHPSGMPSQMLPHPSGMPSQAPGYMPPQMPSNMPPSSYLSSFGNAGTPLSSQHMGQQLTGPFSGSPNPHTFSSGGNPFG